MAVHLHVDRVGCLPTAGNNGDLALSFTPSSPFQQAGMFYQVLPYLEQIPSWQGNVKIANAAMVPVYYCPSRRPPLARGDASGNMIGLNDYAMPLWKDPAEGPGGGGNSAGCWNMWHDKDGDLLDHPYYRNTVFVRGGKGSNAFAPSRLAEITDGTSHVLMVAEKFVDPSRYRPVSIPNEPPQPPWPPLVFTENGYFNGWGDWATLRCSMYGPIRDQPYGTIAYWLMFGSAHSQAINAVFADGSVRQLSYDISNPIFQILCRKNDGRSVDDTAF